MVIVHSYVSLLEGKPNAIKQLAFRGMVNIPPMKMAILRRVLSILPDSEIAPIRREI